MESILKNVGEYEDSVLNKYVQLTQKNTALERDLVNSKNELKLAKQEIARL